MRMLNISCVDDLVANSMDILEPAPVDGDGNEREDGSVSLTLDIY
jgi:5-formyltetrahydrofolate cyclo-ligase